MQKKLGKHFRSGLIQTNSACTCMKIL